MSKPENPYNNAIMESFNKSLKTEIFDDNKVFSTRDEVKKAIFEYIKIFYNLKRRHYSLVYLCALELKILSLQK